ncbi:BatD family protein [Microbulbifer sp. SAOS-129_SWC]|uniref:BatD family protein n=1 Tax=Microbulbifer sp. SAOS-129_SWC TaxID=3145235 RepID=UPI0032166880
MVSQFGMWNMACSMNPRTGSAPAGAPLGHGQPLRTHWATRLLQALLLLLVTNLAHADDLLKATINRSKIGIDETLNLTLRYSGRGNGGQPDFELLEQDFDILSREQANQNVIIQGRPASFVEWTLALAPKHQGKLFIPSLHYQGQVSDAIPIEVTAPGQAPDSGGRQAFLEVELDKKQVHVQEQLLVKVRLYTRIGLHDIATEPLQIPGAHVEKVDEQRYERRINGVGHAVYELTYAVFPESSGELSIPALNYIAVTGRRDPFSLFNRNTQRLRLRSEAQTIKVLPKPDSYSGAQWLPAASFGISQTWSKDPHSFTVGEPITRIVTVRAEGLRAAQLPPLPKLNVEGLKTYPDQPQQDDQVDQKGITGSRIETTAIVATKPGDYQLPPITITWWDTKTGRQRATQLPAFRFTVTGSAAAMSAQNANSNTAPEAGAAGSSKPAAASNMWRNIAIAAIASHLLWVLYFFALRRGYGHPSGSNPKQSRPDAGQQARALEEAAANGDAAQIQQAALNWLRARWPGVPGNSLGEINRELELDELERLQEQLDAALYLTPAKPLNRQQVQILASHLLKRQSIKENTRADKPLPELFS